VQHQQFLSDFLTQTRIGIVLSHTKQAIHENISITPKMTARNMNRQKLGEKIICLQQEKTTTQ